jgi:signal transduction histidine kinase
MNIISNAIDVLKERENNLSKAERKNNPSQIIIQTQCINRPLRKLGFQLDRLRVSNPFSEMSNNDWIQIRIKDNGMGINAEVKKRIFDPFFTTKPVGEGTGLGLSISYQIVVDKHGGRLDCISVPGEGTEFIIEIPTKFYQPVG